MPSSELLSRLILAIFALSAAKLVFEKASALRRVLRALSYMPCCQLDLFHPSQSFGVHLSPILPPRGRIGNLHSKFTPYMRQGASILSSVVCWSATPVFWIADADALDVLLSETNIFRKDNEGLQGVSFYGANLLSADGAVWKRHRSVLRPAFNEANIALVWLKSNQMFAEWQATFEGKREFDNDGYATLYVVNEINKVAFSVLTSVAFGGHHYHASTDSEPASALMESLFIAIENVFFRIAVPPAVLKFLVVFPIPYVSKRVRKIMEAYKTLQAHMLEMISSVRASVNLSIPASTREAVLLKDLVEANARQEGERKHLSDDELLSNIFLMYLGGLDTTTHTVAFCMTLLALLPEIQNKVYEEVKRVWPSECTAVGQQSTYKADFHKLVYTQATIRETLRLNPVFARMNRPCTQDFTLTGRRFEPNSDPVTGEIERFEVHIPKGAAVMMDIEGVHLNPIHWGKDAAEFNPEKFIDTENYRWPRHAFLAFSAGPRQCIGARFALTETVALLANMLYCYEISLMPDIELQIKKMEARGATLTERVNWLVDWRVGMTRTPIRAERVRVKRRV